MTTDTTIRVALSRYLGWIYSPGSPPGASYVEGPVAQGCRWVRLPAQPRQTVCSTFTGGVLGAVYPVDAAFWLDMSIGDPKRPWSPIEAVERNHIGARVDVPVEGRWHLCQGWRGLTAGAVAKGASGHAWLWYGGELGEMSHASSSAGRVLTESRAWTAQRARYDEVRIAVLAESA